MRSLCSGWGNRKPVRPSPGPHVLHRPGPAPPSRALGDSESLGAGAERAGSTFRTCDVPGSPRPAPAPAQQRRPRPARPTRPESANFNGRQTLFGKLKQNATLRGKRSVYSDVFLENGCLENVRRDREPRGAGRFAGPRPRCRHGAGSGRRRGTGRRGNGHGEEPGLRLPSPP